MYFVSMSAIQFRSLWMNEMLGVLIAIGILALFVWFIAKCVSWGTEGYTGQRKPPSRFRLMMEPFVQLMRGLFRIVRLGLVIAGVIVICVGGYGALDESGYISHSRRASVMFPRGQWEVGEYLNCGAWVDEQGNAMMECSREAVSELDVTRDMDVKFRGKLAKTAATFNCQREQDQISCHVVKAEAKK